MLTLIRNFHSSKLTRQVYLSGVFALLAFLGLMSTSSRVHAQDVHVEFFYESLAPYGEWVDHPRHGRVWYPRNVDYNWRPYTLGRWANTEEHGWMWVSEEEWGWGPYHYGRWDMDDRHGWVWIPGDRWGPAWVEWRTGGGHIGWAPLPPEAVWRDDRIFYASAYDYEAPRFRPAWVFVEEVHFVRPRVFVHCLAPAQNITIIKRTTNITNYTVVNQTIINRSINIARIQQVTNQPVPVVKVAQITTPAGLVANASRETTGAQVAVFKPVISNSGKVAIAAGVTAAAVVAVAKATTRPKINAASPPPSQSSASTSSPPTTAQVGKPTVQSPPVVPQTLKSPAELPKLSGPPKSAESPKSLASETKRTVTETKRTATETKKTPDRKVVEPKDRATPSASSAADRQREIRQKQQVEQSALRQRQKDERSKAAAIQKPKVVYNQIRERSEQRRIQSNQRRVEGNRQMPTPAPRASPQPVRKPGQNPNPPPR
jgi:hypothetical protein